MVFGTGRAVALAGVFIAQAGQLVASADAIAVAGLGSSLDGHERHCSESLRFHAAGCKRRSPDLQPQAPAVRPIGSSVAPGGTENLGVPAVPPSAVLEWS